MKKLIFALGIIIIVSFSILLSISLSNKNQIEEILKIISNNNLNGYDNIKISNELVTESTNDNKNFYVYTWESLEIILNTSTSPIELSIINAIFSDTIKIESGRNHGCVMPFEVVFTDNKLSAHYMEYTKHNIIILTEEINKIDFIRDYVILEKLNPETHLAHGPVNINNEFFDWEIIIEINNKSWFLNKGLYTDDIGRAFKINLDSKK